ncbi:MAG TPA: hypothetical protein VMF31_03045 [Solirubrobacterales bacterium]|nr:hypothetical protein [Solirubrobacterales bacterium]
MNEQKPTKNPDRIPRGALVVVAIGLIATLGVLGLDRLGGGTSAELEWTTVEEVKTPPKAAVGPGGVSMDRTTISAIGQNGGGEAIYRIAGAITVDSGGKQTPVQVRCDIESLDPDSEIARTPKRRAAWPRPSDELQAQEVPESAVVKFNAVGNDVLGLPMRDVVRRYTNTLSSSLVDWDGYDPRIQNWVWDMRDGTGPSPAVLGYVVIFKSAEKPDASLKCVTKMDGEEVTQKARATQTEWPLPDPEIDSTEVEAETSTNVE